MGNTESGKIIEVGGHKVRHGNIYEQDGIAKLVGYDKADLFYSDPPWGSGNLRYWDTINKKMNADAKEFEFGFDVDKFLDVVLSASIKYTNGFVVIEYGQRWTQKLIEMATAKGLHYCAQVETLYGGGKRPLDIVAFHTEASQQIDLRKAHHTMGYNCVKTIFSILRPPSNGIVMDLCCGMGYTAQACLDFGMRFIGNELNEKRLQKTIERIQKATCK